MKRAAELWRTPRWRLLVFRRAMLHLGVALVVSALIAGAYQTRTHFMFAACAAGVLLMARAWWDYCRMRDGRPLTAERSKTPYIFRRDKGARRHKPAFLMNSEDFDDDLTPYTTAAEEDFTENEIRRAHMAAYLLSGALMIVISAVL